MGKLIATTQGTVWMELADVKRFDSGVVLLTYRPRRSPD